MMMLYIRQFIKLVDNTVCFHRFEFPNNFGVNFTEAYTNAWNMRIIPSVTYYDTAGAVVHTTSTNISYARKPPDMNLYEDFEVPRGLSYACGASDFQKYVPEMANQTNSTSNPLKSRIATNESLMDGDVEMLILPFIQVSYLNAYT